MLRALGSMIVLLALAMSGCGDEETGVQTGAALKSALADASAGDTVEVAAGRFEGPFEVPSGVDLQGAGRGETVLFAGEGENVLTVLEGDGATQVSSLTIEVGVKTYPDDDLRTPEDESIDEETEIGLYAKSAGRVTLMRVEIDESYGIGIGAEGLQALTMNDVTVAGHVTDGNQGNWPAPTSPKNSPAHGIVVIGTASVSVDGLDVSGLASTGIQLVDSNTTWIDGSVHTNLGASVFVSGGTADISGVSISGLLKGFQLFSPYGMAIANGAIVDTSDVSIQGDAAVDSGSSVGFLQDSSISTHTNLSVTDNGSYGVWVQYSPGTAAQPALVLEAGHNDLSRNAGVGLALIESSGVRIQDTTIEDTSMITRIIGDLSNVEIGDGIEIRRCGDTDCAGDLTDIDVASVSLHRNGRAAMIIEALDAPASGVVCGSIDVDADGIGAIVQNNTDPPGGWAGILNTGSADVLETVRGLDPSFNQGGSLDGIAGR